MSLSPPCIPAEPDISGIGVRVAIYAQNLFSFIPAISALSHGEVALYELDAVKDQSTTILITAFGILISAMVQAQTLGLPNFHATIILNLSWMNNTNTFIYFLLYLQHKSQLGPQQIKSDLESWFKYGKTSIAGAVTLDDAKKDGGDAAEESDLGPRSLLSAIFRVKVRGMVGLLGSLHLSMMSALGLWLWSKPLAFGTATDANACAMSFASTAILGKRVPLASSGLRIWSLLIYSVFLVPGLNLIVPMVGFLLLMQMHRASHHPRRINKFDPSWRGSLLSAPNSAATPPDRRAKLHAKGVRDLARRSLWALQAWYNPFLLPIFAAMILLFATNIIFIVDTEAALRRNRDLQTEGESDWTFGQTLAVLLLILPLRDLRVFGARRDVSALLRNALHWRAPTEILWDLVRRGADVNVQAEGSQHPTVLLLAVSRQDIEFTKILLSSSANPDIAEESGSTALQMAASQGNLEVAKLLLEQGADPDIEGGSNHFDVSKFKALILQRRRVRHCTGRGYGFGACCDRQTAA
ncbi:hypothetical protein C8R47DRAFT_712660 [Mycena vitilis]|nr:hypothetical protein C8R47DRAFT_712660 [Mycena vitilis]